VKTARIYFFKLVFGLLLAALMNACASQPPTPFVPPTAPEQINPIATEIRLIAPPTAALQSPLLPPSETPTPAPSPTPTCQPNLEFLTDLTYPDGTVVAPGSIVEKQWRVLNSGSCNWNTGYRLRLVDGFSPLGAAPEQALYPALAGSETTLQIIFSAPNEPGLYRSSWQAYDSEGAPFGVPIFIEIIVQ